MEVLHQSEQQRFVVLVDGDESVLEYQLLPGDAVDFSRTYVPEKLRGQGIAEKLVRTGLAWAREQGLGLQASCWYARRFIKQSERHD